MHPCLIKSFTSTSDYNTEDLDFLRAYNLQNIFRANKTNQCEKPLPYLKLKELVDKSGKNYV